MIENETVLDIITDEDPCLKVKHDHIKVSPIQLKIYKRFEDLENIQLQWDELVQNTCGDIFMTYHWCRIWWKYYGQSRNLRIFVFFQDDRLVGIFPLFFEKIWLGPVYLRAVKIVGSDFTLTQFGLAVYIEHLSEVTRIFFEELSRYKLDIIHIGPIAGLYKHYDVIKESFQQQQGPAWRMLESKSGDQTYFSLPQSWEEHISRLKKNEKSNIRKNYNSIERQINGNNDLFKTTSTCCDNCCDYFDEFVKLHQKHWNSIGKLGHFGDWPKSLQFHQELIRTHSKLGRLRLFKIEIGRECIGFQYHYKFANKYIHFLDARPSLSAIKGISPGRISFCETIKEAINEKVNLIDSLRGRYEHKLRLGGKLFPIRNLYIIPEKTSTIIRVAVFRTLAIMLDLFYYKIWFSRIAPRLPLKRNALWQAWIRTAFFIDNW